MAKFITFAVFMLLNGSGLIQAVETPPEKSAVLKAGISTTTKSATMASAWTAVYSIKNLQVSVEVFRTPTSKRWKVFIDSGAGPEPYATIVETNGRWLVDEQSGTRGTYRPFEAQLRLPNFYYFLFRSELEIIQIFPPGSKFDRMDGGTAIYRVPLAESLQQTMKTSLDAIAQIERTKKLDPQLEAAREQTKKMLANGVPMRIDMETGIIVEQGVADKAVRIEGFRWVEKVLDSEFALDVKGAPEVLSDPVAGTPLELQDLVMIGYNASWTPAIGKAIETDVVLLNLKSGEMRRVPIRGAGMSGCFLKDRTSVCVSAVDLPAGAIRPMEVNLRTGENRWLGGPELEAGFTMGPSLSPDGKTLAAFHKNSGGTLFDGRIVLIDISTGKSRYIGKRVDAFSVNWLPDGTGLILLTRETPNLDQPSIGTICRMDLNGEITQLCSGDSPIVIPSTRTIVFEERIAKSERVWKQCDLDGKNAKVLHSGFHDMGFPTVSPDGKRLIMMRFNPATGPRPTIIDLDSGNMTPASDKSGFWMKPAWR